MSSSSAVFLWGRHSEAITTAILIGCPAGVIFAPLLVGSFLCSSTTLPVDTMTAIVNVTSGTAMSNVTYNASSSNAVDAMRCRSPIEIPHAIVGAFTLSIAIVFLCFHCIQQPAELKMHCGGTTMIVKKDATTSGSRFGRRPDCFTISALALATVFMFLHWGRSGTLAQFLFTYVTEGDMQLDNKEAALWDFGQKCAFFIGRLTAIPTLKYVNVLVAIAGTNLLAMASTVCLVVFGIKHKVALLTFACLVQGLSSHTWPGTIQWLNKYFVFGGITMTALDIGLGTGGFTFSWLNGYLLSNDKHDGVLYLSMTCAVLVVVVCAAMILFTVTLMPKLAPREITLEVTVDINKDTEETSPPSNIAPLLDRPASV